jgi:hypothetical protein
MSQPYSFSIEAKINPLTQQPFGPKYSGNFFMRRPSFLDETMIECRISAERNAFGMVDLEQIPAVFSQVSRLFNTLAQVSTEKTPVWFDRTTIHLDDETDMKALAAVNVEVGGFLASFRPVKDSSASTEGS